LNAKLQKAIEELIEKSPFADQEVIKQKLLKEIPRGWDRYGDFFLLPETSFISDEWEHFGSSLWIVVADALGTQRLGKKSKIPKEDLLRRPRVRLLLGDNGWVSHVDNGIKCSWDATKCMFSSGNGTEKKRMGELDSRDMTVVDLYAGIGYFTLPFLIHGKAKMVHACEWNPDAVEALRLNLKQNSVKDRCEVHEGDNAIGAPENVADRINLGLIPSSEKGWPIAVRALRKDVGGWLHIHENVTEGQEEEWKGRIINKLTGYFEDQQGSTQEKTKWSIRIHHIETVKSYAPRIFHLVADVECRPSSQSV